MSKLVSFTIIRKLKNQFKYCNACFDNYFANGALKTNCRVVLREAFNNKWPKFAAGYSIA